MAPIQLGVLKIYPFGLFFAVLLALFFIWSAWRMRKNGLNRETAGWFALLSVPLGFVLARLGFCLFAADQIFGGNDIGMVFRVTEGGFLLWGGIGGLLLAAKLTGKITRQSGPAVSDSMIVPACLLILAVRLLCGLLFRGFGTGLSLDYWFDPEETDFAFRYSIWPLEDYSFFERFPFAVPSYYGSWCWAVFVLQALWAGCAGFLVSRTRSAPGGKTARFVILYSCGTIVLESMLCGGEIVTLPWLGFVKANQVLSAAALAAVALIALRKLEKGCRLRPALLFFLQFAAAAGIVVAMEFAAFEKKITAIEWLPADACHLIMGLACLWMALALRPLRKKAWPAPGTAR